MSSSSCPRCDHKFNGWTNWYTWELHLHLRDYFQSLWDEWDGEEETAPEFTLYLNSRWDMADYVKSTAKELLFTPCEPTNCSDLMVEFAKTAFNDEVNWFELADDLIDTYEKEWKDEEKGKK